MPTRIITANVVGIAACTVLGWAVYHVVSLLGTTSTSCGTIGEPACPAVAGTVTELIAALAVALLARAFGGQLAWPGILLAIGVGVLLTAWRPGADRGFAFSLGGTATVFGLVSLGKIRLRRRVRARDLELMARGVRAIGTIINVQDTGVKINDNPRVRVRYRVVPRDGTATFEAEKSITFPLLNLPRLGQRHAIVYLPEKRDNIWVLMRLTDDLPEDLRQLAAVAAEGGPMPSGMPVDVPVDSPGPVDPSGQVDPLDRLAKLNALRLAGGLTDEEYERQKRRLLDES